MSSIGGGSHKKRLDIHVCELPKTSDSYLLRLPPNAAFYSRWKRNFQKILLVWIHHPLTRLFLRSTAAIAFERRRHGRSLLWWVIHPYSSFRFYWNCVMSLTFLYMFVTIPYIYTFQRVAQSSGPESWELVYPAYIICIIDIIINFVTGFTTQNGPEIFLDPLLIIQHYIQGYFIIDFASSVPFTWFFKYRIPPPGNNSNSLLLIPEFLLQLKVCRIYTLRCYLKHLIADFSFSYAEIKVAWLALLMMLILHWCSCLTHLFPFIVTHLSGITKEKSDMYFITAGVYTKSDLQIYLMYFHMGMSNFFGSSFIELNTLGTADNVIRCILLLFGKGCIIYILVTVLQLVQSVAEPELKYEQIMQRVKEYISEKELPEKLRDRLILYYEYRFQGSYFKENTISVTLSNHLNQEIMTHSSLGLLDTATILHYLPRYVIGNLMGILKSVIYLSEDIIYKSETEGDCMFFIVNGTVALITYDGTEICHEKDGSYFGEAALIFHDRRRLESAIALEVCELLRLNRQDFKRMFPSTSTFYKRLEKVAKERQDRINKINAHRRKGTTMDSALNMLQQKIEKKGSAGPFHFNSINANDDDDEDDDNDKDDKNDARNNSI